MGGMSRKGLGNNRRFIFFLNAPDYLCACFQSLFSYLIFNAYKLVISLTAGGLCLAIYEYRKKEITNYINIEYWVLL